jgi:hypothetical protein
MSSGVVMERPHIDQAAELERALCDPEAIKRIAKEERMNRPRIDQSAELERALCNPNVIRRTARLLAAAAREDFWEFRNHIAPKLIPAWWQFDVGWKTNLNISIS